MFPIRFPRKPIAGAVLAASLFVLAACGHLAGDASPPESSPAPTSTAGALPASPPPLVTFPAPVENTPLAPPEEGTWYAIDAVARSDEDVYRDFTLHLLRGKRSGDELFLQAAFEYQGDQQMFVLGGASPSDVLLVDAAGTTYSLRDADLFLISFDPNGERFWPGGGVSGNLVFPFPAGPPPYRLQFPEYESVEFTLEKSRPCDRLETLPPGEYEINQVLISSDETLAPVALRVDSLRVDGEGLTFRVAFVNTLRQGYDVWGIGGERDVILLDEDRNQYPPLAASETLATGISPDGGWSPGEALEGSLTFPLPEAPGTIRFVFLRYPALSLSFDRRGLREVAITSPTGGPPPPTPTPKASQTAYQALNEMLAQQARAIERGDEAAYLAPFAPELRDEQALIFRRMAEIPLETYALSVSPAEDLDEAESGVLQGVEIQGTYTLQGLPSDNPFRYLAEYDFVRQGDAWQITRLENETYTPFWFLGEVRVESTPHFLVFIRPEGAQEFGRMAAALETAYARLQDRGLPVEPYNVAFFTGPEENLRELTGIGGTRVLGLALAQYSIENDALRVTSRAFFINGEAFTDHADTLEAGEFETTILHEMVHLALAKTSRPFVPPWLSEGLAVYYAGQAPREQLRELPRWEDFETLSLSDLTQAERLGEYDVLGTQVGAEYLYSGAVVTYLAETYGEEAVLDFYRAYAEVPDAEVAESFTGMFADLFFDIHMSEMAVEKSTAFVPQYFGCTLEELDSRVKAWLRSLGG